MGTLRQGRNFFPSASCTTTFCLSAGFSFSSTSSSRIGSASNSPCSGHSGGKGRIEAISARAIGGFYLFELENQNALLVPVAGERDEPESRLFREQHLALVFDLRDGRDAD